MNGFGKSVFAEKSINECVENERRFREILHEEMKLFGNPLGQLGEHCLVARLMERGVCVVEDESD